MKMTEDGDLKFKLLQFSLMHSNQIVWESIIKKLEICISESAGAWKFSYPVEICSRKSTRISCTENGKNRIELIDDICEISEIKMILMHLIGWDCSFQNVNKSDERN